MPTVICDSSSSTSMVSVVVTLRKMQRGGLGSATIETALVRAPGHAAAGTRLNTCLHSVVDEEADVRCLEKNTGYIRLCWATRMFKTLIRVLVRAGCVTPYQYLATQRHRNGKAGGQHRFSCPPWPWLKVWVRGARQTQRWQIKHVPCCAGGGTHSRGPTKA